MKRFLILPLTFLMLTSTLIGCTNFGDNSDNDTENNSSNTNNNYNPPPNDNGGNTGGNTGNDAPPQKYSYTVIHYKSDTYKTEEETFYATAGTTVTLVPKQYEFYHPDPDNPTQIKIDYDYRMVYLYYDRNEVKLTFDYNDGVSEILEDTFYAGWEVYLNSYNPGERENLIFKGWEPPLPDIVPNEDTTYTAQWSYHTVTPSIGINLPSDTIELFREDESYSWGKQVSIKFRCSNGAAGHYNYYNENELSWEVNGIDLAPLNGNGGDCDFEWDIYQTTGREYKYSFSFLTPDEPANPDLCNIKGEFAAICSLGDDIDSPDDDYIWKYPYHLGINDVYVTIKDDELYPLSYHFQILIEE